MAAPGFPASLSLRFPRSHRLLSPAEFRNVFDLNASVRDQAFRVLHRANGRDHARLGLAVSRKACRSSVGRNRLKRLVRESFRRHQHLLAGWDIVVLPTPQAATICNADITRRLAALWQKLGDRERNTDAGHGNQ